MQQFYRRVFIDRWAKNDWGVKVGLLAGGAVFERIAADMRVRRFSTIILFVGLHQ